MSTVEKKKTTVVPPFGVEINHPQNNDVLLSSIINCRLRSQISNPQPIKDAKTGEPCLPIDQTIRFGRFPTVPGMQVHVNPEKLEYVILDPLHGDEKLCETIRKRLNESSVYRVTDKLGGVPPQKGELDKHRMKTLCRELLRLRDLGWANVVKGPTPSLEDVNDLPGNYLLNPGARMQNMQPPYECDWENWVAQLARTGG